MTPGVCSGRLCVLLHSGEYSGKRSPSRREKGSEFSIALIANVGPVDRLEDRYPLADSGFGAQQGDLD